MTQPVATARDRWLSARDQGPHGFRIGGSEAAAVIGWNEYEDPIAVFSRKRGLTDPEPENDRMHAGRVFERAILTWYGEKTGRHLFGADLVAACMICLDAEAHTDLQTGHADAFLRDEHHAFCDDDHQHEVAARELARMLVPHLHVAFGPDDGHVIFASKADPWAIMTPDAFAYDDSLGWGIVDAKNVGERQRPKWLEGVPPLYAAQIAHYVRPTELTWGGFAVLVGGQELLCLESLRTDIDDVARVISDEVPRFIRDHLEAGVPPVPTVSEASARALRDLYGEPRPRSARAWIGEIAMADGTRWTPEAFDEEYESVSTRANELYRRRDAMQAIIRYVAKDAERVILPSGVHYEFSKRKDGSTSLRRRG